MRLSARLWAATAMSTIFGGLVGGGAPLTAAAQDGVTPGLEEIVVTGTRREETLRDAAVSVTVFSENDLREANVTRPEDFLELTPNVTFVNSNQPGEAYITIRGNTQVRSGDTSTALVIDGVQQIGQNNVNQKFATLEQIEILKGPQGALYGRNAIGGAVVIKTRTPNMEVFEGEIAGGIGNISQGFARATVSGPIIPNELAFRASLAYDSDDGGYTNIFTGEDAHRFEEQTLRGRLYWTPNDLLTVDAKLRWTRMQGGAIGWNALITDDFSPAGGFLDTAFNLTPNADAVDGDNTELPFVANIPGFTDNYRKTASVKADYTVPDWGTFTLVGAYELVEDFFGADSFPYLFRGGFPVGVTSVNPEGPGGETQYTFRENQIIQIDGRFSSEYDGPFNFIVGGQAAWFDITNETASALDTAGINLGRAPNPASSLNQTTGFNSAKEDNNFFGVFLNLFYNVNERLELTASVRYDRETKKQQNFVGCEDPAPNEDVVLAAVFCDNQLERNIPLPTYVRRPGLTREATFDQVQPRISARYDVTDYASVYASYSIGFKTGGFNPFGTRAILVALVPDTTVQDVFPKEKATNYEAGFKTDFWGGRARVNGAVFYTETDNAQLLEFRPLGTLLAVSTADEVSMLGFELDFTAAVTDYLTISGGMGYLDTDIERFDAQPQNEGGARPQTSKWTGNLAATVNAPLVGDYEFIGRIDYRYQSRTFWDWRNTFGSSRSDFNIINGRVAITQGDWEVSVFGRNITDTEYNEEVIPILPGLTDALYRARPRTFGAEVSYRF